MTRRRRRSVLEAVRICAIVPSTGRAVVRAFVPMLAALLVGCGEERPSGRGISAGAAESAAEVAALPWDSVIARAHGTTVVWRMWRGDPSINRYIDEWVAPRLRDRFAVTLRAVDGQGPEIVNQLVVEREAGRGTGTASLVWINGETFANLRQERLLGGPWADKLPNARYVDSSSQIIMRDFEQDLAGYESPWGTVQFALIHDTVRTPNPPRTFAALSEWILAHPGRFTHDQGFTGMTFLKMLMYAEGGGVQRFAGGFDSTAYVAGRARVLAWLGRTRGAFWREGTTYPPDVAAMHRLFANGEIDFSMSNNQHDVVTKVRQGILPPTSRPLLLRDGTIANAHYVGIPANAPNPAGAMLVANFLLSPEAQLEKRRPDVWADGTVLAPSRLPDVWAARFAAIERDPREIPRDSLARYAVPEVAPAYHERLSADWRARIRTAP
ncbi:MAG: ABC transporter substrate-binding protein [Gemmatimonadaceae bacterium]|nr:ABC transporter substrate-binding protein [Gemmatimonadaceae bacterium]